MSEELWLPVPTYEGLYEISNEGRVRSIARVETFNGTERPRAEKVLRIDAGRAMLSKDGRQSRINVKRLKNALFPDSDESLQSLEGERWLPVEGFGDRYEISNLYRVRSKGFIASVTGQKDRVISPKIIKTWRNNGRLVASLIHEGFQRMLYLEATVQRMFPEVKPDIIDNLGNPGELWKPVIGYEGLYEVSSEGRVKGTGRYVNGHQRRYIHPYILKGSSAAGYPKADLSRNGRTKTFSVHRLVAIAFIPNPLGLEVVHHVDEDKTNPRAENLEWVSTQKNISDWFDRRRIVIGVDTIEMIIAAAASGKTPAEILALLPKRRKKSKNRAMSDG